MASEVIKLNLIPKGEMPVFHASQFDTGRLITCELYRGEDAYSVPEGYTVELHCRKVDNNIVTMASTLINDNVVTFTSTEQLTACNGKNLCEVAILDDGYRIGTLNFILEVEVDPLKGGINSTSEIHNLETQVEEITTEIIGENYYNKTEVDDLLDTKADADSVYTIGDVNTLLSGKANASDVYTKTQTDTLLSAKADVSDVYTKTQTDTLLSAKADVSDVYTKTQTDTLLSAKANASDVYTKTQTDTLLSAKANAADVYTKQEVDNIIMDIMPVDTASGPIATFDTEIAAPLVNVSCNIVATGGNGTPDNPNPINGYTEANITRCGVNLMHVDSRVSQTTASVTYTSDDNYLYLNGTKSGGGYADMSNLIMTLPRGNYHLKAFVISGTASNTVSLYAFDGTNNISGDILGGEKSMTLNKTTTFRFRFAVWADGTVCTNYKVGIVISTASISEYSEYTGNTYTVNFGQTVYGGVLDVTRGKLTVTYGGVALSDTSKFNFTYDNISKRWQSPFSNIKVFAQRSADVLAEQWQADITATAGNENKFFTVGGALYFYTSDNVNKPVGNLVYPLKTPLDIDLTPEVISAVVGTNNIYSDTNGDTTVKFKDSIQHYIDNH